MSNLKIKTDVKGFMKILHLYQNEIHDVVHMDIISVILRVDETPLTSPS